METGGFDGGHGAIPVRSDPENNTWTKIRGKALYAPAPQLLGTPNDDCCLHPTRLLLLILPPLAFHHNPHHLCRRPTKSKPVNTRQLQHASRNQTYQATWYPCVSPLVLLGWCTMLTYALDPLFKAVCSGESPQSQPCVLYAFPDSPTDTTYPGLVYRN